MIKFLLAGAKVTEEHLIEMQLSVLYGERPGDTIQEQFRFVPEVLRV